MTEKQILLKQRKLEKQYDKLVKLCTAVKQDSYELFREIGVDKSMKTKITPIGKSHIRWKTKQSVCLMLGS